VVSVAPRLGRSGKARADATKRSEGHMNAPYNAVSAVQAVNEAQERAALHQFARRRRKSRSASGELGCPAA